MTLFPVNAMISTVIQENKQYIENRGGGGGSIDIYIKMIFQNLCIKLNWYQIIILGLEFRKVFRPTPKHYYWRFHIPTQSPKYYNENNFAQLEQEIMTYCIDSEYIS